MWRVDVLVVLSVIFVGEGAEHRYGPHLQRLKRSPQYDCPPFGSGGPPRFWPPPPRHRHFGPPPYWPPPQDETNQQEQASQAQSSAQSGALTQKAGAQNGGPGRGSGIERGQDQEIGQGPERGQGQRGPSQGDGGPYPGNQPCDTCGGQESAVSNAKSETGSAVAIAISGKNSGK